MSLTYKTDYSEILNNIVLLVFSGELRPKDKICVIRSATAFLNNYNPILDWMPDAPYFSQITDTGDYISNDDTEHLFQIIRVDNCIRELITHNIEKEGI